jgi:hypothetical protein
MASTIKLKNGSGAPTTGDLVQGEPALDLTNKRLYTENASGVVIEVGTNPSTIDINAGTIDGTVIGGSTAAAITGTTITGTSFVSSGDMTFEDNDKAVFGNGSDLRIYHTGSHSTIENIGTGHLQIHSTDFRLRNSAGTESMILANADGNVQLYYDNALKLATTSTGIDVTGTVTADGLTVSGAQNSKVAYFDDTSEGGYRQLQFTSSNNGQFWDINSQGTSGGLGGVLTLSTRSIDRMEINTGGDVSFYEDTGTTAKFFWDASAESLGIGGTPSGYALDVTAPFGSTIGGAYIEAGEFNKSILTLNHTNGSVSVPLLSIQKSGSDVVTVASSGKVGIGVSTPSNNHANANNLVVGNGTAGGIANYVGTGLGWYAFSRANANNSDAYDGGISYDGSRNLMFHTNAGVERMRISSAGHTTFGTTTLTPAESAVNGTSILADGRVNHNAQSQAAAIIGRTGTDGTIVDFRKSGTAVGSIGTIGSDLYVGTGDTGLRFLPSSDAILPAQGSTGATRDDAIDIGTGTARFDDIYATNGTIQTSDRNEKQDIEVLSDAEQRVALACKGLLRKFRWKSKVEEKGDDARIHFGIIAQDLQAAFEAEGLDAGRYAMFISSTWTDEETGEERSRMGVRYSELLAFIIAAI